MEHRATSAAIAPSSDRRRRAWSLLVALAITVASLWAARITLFVERGANKTTATTPSAMETGTINVVQPEPIGTDSSISATPHPLVLSATRPGRNAREGYADLGISELSPQTYAAGALLANGVRLEEIYPDYVVLAKGTKRARLYVSGHAAPVGEAQAESALLMVGGPQPAAAVTVEASSHDRLTDVMRVSPVYDGDTLVGLEVYDNTNSDALSRLGLQPADRITAVDGVKVTSPADSLAQLRQLLGGAAMTVTIERGGHSQNISLDGTALSGVAKRG